MEDLTIELEDEEEVEFAEFHKQQEECKLTTASMCVHYMYAWWSIHLTLVHCVAFLPFLVILYLPLSCAIIVTLFVSFALFAHYHYPHHDEEEFQPKPYVYIKAYQCLVYFELKL